MIKKEKIFELKIQEDDDLSGIDSISLVDEPAIEVNWVAFKKEVQEDFHIPDGEDETYLGKLLSKGQPEQELLDEGWEIDRIESVKENFATTPNDESYQDNSFYRVRYKYALNSNIRQSAIIPTTRQFCRQLIQKNFVWRIEEVENELNSFGQSAQFWRGGYNCRHEWFRIFYKKTGDITNKSSVNRNKITGGGFPVELSPEWLQPSTVTDKTASNPSPSTIKNLGLSKERLAEVGPRGGIKESDKAPKSDTPNKNPQGEGSAKGDASGKSAKVSAEQEKTLQNKVDEFNEKESNTKNGRATLGQLKSVFQRGLGAFNTSHSPVVKSAEQWAYARVNAYLYLLKNGRPENPKYNTDYDLLPKDHPKANMSKQKLDITPNPCWEGYEPIGLNDDGSPRCVPIKENMESVSDYPDSVKNNAKAVLKWVDENGWGSCGTEVGKIRANQLAKGEPISEDTVRRMYSYLSRHKVDLEKSKSYDDGCGKLMYDSWGGLSALSWAESKVNSFNKQKFLESCPDATQDVATNLKNRQECIDVANYGPLNPNEPNEEYWKKKADMFGGDLPSAKKALCGNCAFFVQTKSMLDCIANGINDTNEWDTIDAGDLGYCEAFDFKCAASRTCDAWVVGGPITEEDMGYDVGGLPAYVDQLPKKKKKKYDNEDMSNQHFATDSEKHIVLGPAMIPDQKIFRKDALGNPYYVYFTSETIKMIAEKYMRNKYTDNNDTMHDGKAIKDIHVLESWIKEDVQDKSSKYGFENLPVGTWFVSMKVNNPKIWEEVKSGKLNGFSVSGFFEEVAAFSREEMFLYKVAEVLKNIKD